MQYRNNLTDEWANAYFRVVSAFDVYLLVGTSESNTYAGRSMVLGNVYRKVTLAPGDEIHDTHGGVFAVQDQIGFSARMLLPTKHPFEKGPDSVGAWPLDKLQRIADADRRPATYQSRVPQRAPGAVRCPNGIDSVEVSS